MLMWRIAKPVLTRRVVGHGGSQYDAVSRAGTLPCTDAARLAAGIRHAPFLTDRGIVEAASSPALQNRGLVMHCFTHCQAPFGETIEHRLVL
jgi:hypothetical protein